MARTRSESSDEEISEQQTIYNKRFKKTIYKNDKSNEHTCAPFELINLNNTVSIPPDNPFYDYNNYSSSYTSNSRQLRNLDPELIYNSDYIPSNIPIRSNFNPNLTYNTYLSSQNANRSQVLFNNTNNSEDRSMISRNSEDTSDLHSSSYQDKDSPWQQNMHNNYKENDLRSNQRPQHASYSPANFHNTATRQLENNSQELTFSDEQLLINWLCTRPDLITQVQNLLIES
ncbi:hypothetical protein C2G38_2207109 [Gigaspora rosea]|uniref:Uncharacterized protein n=1 Tax=Gigaspora rosea TaxID=44941 RepID=A0A397UIX1_9GLOM|nr:hypothetical protein C2G38_2207109 [Gigaspora rosea]